MVFKLDQQSSEFEEIDGSATPDREPTEAERLTRKHVFVAGKVQGVGFRWSACSRASELGLTGWVRNLADRRVELCFQGEQGAVAEMEDLCRAGPLRSRIIDISVSEEAPVEGETGFKIR